MRAHDHPNFYAAFVRDPDGRNVEACIGPPDCHIAVDYPRQVIGAGDRRERRVTRNPQIVGSIDHSPLQINHLFIVLFKRILDPGL